MSEEKMVIGPDVNPGIEIDTGSELFMGSSGTARPLSEWVSLIEAITIEAMGFSIENIAGVGIYNSIERAWRVKVNQAQLKSQQKNPTLNEKKILEKELNLIGAIAGEHFKNLAYGALNKHTATLPDLDRVIAQFSDEIVVLSRRISQTVAKKKPAIVKVGECLVSYLLEFKSLPTTRQALENFSIENGEHIPYRTISKHIHDFDLGEICRANKKG